MASAKNPRRARGSIDLLPSGAYRVRVYAGSDPLTGKRHDLVEVVPAGPTARAEAERVRLRFLNEIAEQRNPRSRATVNQLMDRYLTVLDIAETSREAYVSCIENHIRPALGELALSRWTPRFWSPSTLSCAAAAAAATVVRLVDHRVTGEHDCDSRCRPHTCRPISPATIRKIHWTLSGAMARAVRWRWVGVNAAETAEPPPPPKPAPSPPSADEAARLADRGVERPGWGAFLWIAATTGARRGELCALRRDHLDLAAEVLTVDGSVYGTRVRPDGRTPRPTSAGGSARPGDGRRPARTPGAAGRDRAPARGEGADDRLPVLERSGLLATLAPGTVSQRYDRMAERLGISTSLHKLRHFNATELLAAGVDLRTVAGRLGHAGGGTTTLRVYAAWVTEADHRAAQAVASRLPSRPEG